MAGVNKAAERTFQAMLLSALGGMMDGYSYVVRGGVFATGQTGNLLIFGYGLLSRQPDRALRALVPIVGFWCGIFAAQSILRRFSHNKTDTDWKRTILLLEAAALLGIGLVPDSVLDIIPNTMISLLAAMQFCTFREFGDRSSYASVFCTGNMRSCAECYYQGLVEKDPAALKRAVQYTGILTAFLAGAMIAMGLGELIGEKAIWFGAAMALLCGFFIRS